MASMLGHILIRPAPMQSITLLCFGTWVCPSGESADGNKDTKPKTPKSATAFNPTPLDAARLAERLTQVKTEQGDLLKVMRDGNTHREKAVAARMAAVMQEPVLDLKRVVRVWHTTYSRIGCALPVCGFW